MKSIVGRSTAAKPDGGLFSSAASQAVERMVKKMQALSASVRRKCFRLPSKKYAISIKDTIKIGAGVEQNRGKFD